MTSSNFNGVLHGQVTRFGAFQDLVHIGGGAAKFAVTLGPYVIRPPASASSLSGKIPGSCIRAASPRFVCGHSKKHRAWLRDARVRVCLSHGGKGLVERIRSSHFHGVQLHAQGAGGSLRLVQSWGHCLRPYARGVGDAGDVWHSLLEQLQPFPH